MADTAFPALKKSEWTTIASAKFFIQNTSSERIVVRAAASDPGASDQKGLVLDPLDGWGWDSTDTWRAKIVGDITDTTTTINVPVQT